MQAILYRFRQRRCAIICAAVLTAAFLSPAPLPELQGRETERVEIKNSDSEQRLKNKIERIVQRRVKKAARLRELEQKLESERNPKRRARIETRVKKLRAQIAGLDASLEKLRFQLENGGDGGGPGIEVLSNEIAQLNNDIDAAKKKREELVKKRDELIEENGPQLDEANKQLKKALRDCKNAGKIKNKKEREKKLEECKKNLKAAQERVEGLAQGPREIDETIRGLDESILESEVDAKLAEIEKLKKERESADAKRKKEINRKIAACEKELKRKRVKLQELDNEPQGDPDEEDELTDAVKVFPESGTRPPEEEDEPKTVRMGTWNLRGMGISKAAAVGNQVAQAVKDNYIDIIALQEVNGLVNPGFPIAPPALAAAFSSRGYVFLPGRGVRKKFRNRKPAIRELCPIAFNPNQLDCSYSANPADGDHKIDSSLMHAISGSANRASHSLICRAKGSGADKKPFDFVFSCLHLGTKQRDVQKNLNSLTSNVRTLRSLSGNQDIILAGDFNSHPRDGAHLKGTWAAVTGMGLDLRDEALLGPLQFTKLYKSRGLKISKAKRRQIDDILWFEPTVEDYIEKSKRVLYVMHSMFPGGTSPGPAFDRYYKEISDHLPVVADFHGHNDSN